MRASVLDSGSVPNRSMPAAAQVGPFRSTAIESDMSVLVSAVQPHQVDGRVLGEAGLMWVQLRPDVDEGCDDLRVLGVTHVEVAQQDCVGNRAKCAEHPAKLTAAQPGSSLATVEMQ